MISLKHYILIIAILTVFIFPESLFSRTATGSCINSVFKKIEFDYRIGMANYINNTSPIYSIGVENSVDFRFIHFHNFSFGFNFAVIAHTGSNAIEENSAINMMGGLNLEYDISSEFIVGMTFPQLIMAPKERDMKKMTVGISFVPELTAKYVFLNRKDAAANSNRKTFYYQYFFCLSYRCIIHEEFVNNIICAGVGFAVR